MNGLLMFLGAVGAILCLANLIGGFASGVMKFAGQYGESKADRSTNPTRFWLIAVMNSVGVILALTLAINSWRGS